MSKINGEYQISVAQLRLMREAGMGHIAIGRAMGVNPSTVRNWLIKFGLPTRLAPRRFSDAEVLAAVMRWRKHTQPARGYQHN